MIVNCRRFTELLTDASEGKVASWEESHFAEHARLCGACRKYARDFDKVVHLLRDLPKEPAPEGLKSALLERFKSRR
ncbi:MAG: hypothetical protein IPK82_43030 [Polyangiaceae bacterium]|nr:hypothetical protein [Polyangiaceae bacterium]